MKRFVGWTIPVAIYSFKIWALVVLFLMTVVLQAQDQEPPQFAAEDESFSQAIGGEVGVQVSPSDSATTEEKKRKASIALLAVGGIAILGVGIIAATMIWARRLRRLARNNGPPQRTRGNDFWFLKPRKPTSTSSLIENEHRLPQGDRRDDQS